MIGLLLRRYWREVALSVLLVLTAGLFTAYRREVRLRANSVEQGHLAAQLLAMTRRDLQQAQAKVDTVLRVIKTYHVDTLHTSDTVYVAGNPVPQVLVPLPVAIQTNDKLRKCDDLVSSCERFRDEALTRFALDSGIIVGLSSKTCTQGNTKAVIAGGILGALIGKHVRW